MSDGPTPRIGSLGGDEALMHRAASSAVVDPFEGVDFEELERSLYRPRTLLSAGLSLTVTLMTLLALVPLFTLLVMLIGRGGRNLSRAMLTGLPPAPLDQGGGFGNAILGTLMMVGIATLITVPIGVLAGIYLVQASGGGKVASMARLSARALTGLPSILVGIFAYGAIVLATGGFSALAGGAALAILMLPTIILASESALAAVPERMREAAVALGATHTQTFWMVLLPAALPGIFTGVMLAVARAAGETAPLLFTALFSNYWLTGLGQPTASLSVLIYNFSSMPFREQVDMAWSAALVLVLLILIMKLIGQLFARREILE